MFSRHFYAPGMVFLSAGLLVTALFLPFMTIQKLFGDDPYSLPASIRELWTSNHQGLAIIIFLFSIVFPFTKLTGLALLWFRRTDSEKRKRLLNWLSLLGKWSMLDVFVTAILIVLIKAGSLVDAVAELGIYVFAAAILLSMIASITIERLARKADGE